MASQNTTTTQATTTALVASTSHRARSATFRACDARYRAQTLLAAWESAARSGYLATSPEEARAVATACYGLTYTLSTGRASGTFEAALYRLTPGKLAALVVEVASKCATIAEVPHYVSTTLAPRLSK